LPFFFPGPYAVSKDVNDNSKKKGGLRLVTEVESNHAGFFLLFLSFSKFSEKFNVFCQWITTVVDVIGTTSSFH